MYHRKAEFFKEITKGTVNFYKCSKHNLLSYELWRQLSKSISTPEELEDYEHIPLCEANIGGVHYSKKGIFKNSTDYDINMMYQHYLSSNNFTFPIGKPKITKITTEELYGLPFFQYGLYKCKFGGKSIWIPEEFNENFSWLPHYILTIAKSEKLEILMCDDNESNVMLYGNRMTGKIAFGEFTNKVYDIRKKCKDTEFESDGKLLSSSFWGYLCSKNKKSKKVTQDDNLDEDDFDIVELKPIEEGYYMKYIDKIQKLKFAYGRIGCFLTSYCRYQLYTLLKKTEIKTDDIICLNTDGFILKDGVRMPSKLIGPEAGMLKIAKKNDVILDNVTIDIKHCNRYSAIE